MSTNLMSTNMSISVNHKVNTQHWLVVFFMASCFAFAWWLTPKATWFEHIGSPQFEHITPKNFGDWAQVEETGGGTIIDPEQQDAINNLYTQTVSRTYVQQATGRRIMLSLAYGDNQTFSKQLHRPEACYSSQGFKIENLHDTKMQVSGQLLTINRMTGIIGQRVEQVTYWIRIGDKVISGPATALNMARMGMGLKGFVADGLLFRVSEVSEDAESSYILQNQFINDFLQALNPAQQMMVLGLKQS